MEKENIDKRQSEFNKKLADKLEEKRLHEEGKFRKISDEELDVTTKLLFHD